MGFEPKQVSHAMLEVSTAQRGGRDVTTMQVLEYILAHPHEDTVAFEKKGGDDGDAPLISFKKPPAVITLPSSSSPSAPE
jgi:hypothetical protein